MTKRNSILKPIFVFLLSCCLGQLWAQTPVEFTVITEYTETKAYAKVQLTNFENISGLQFSINWNAAALEYKSIRLPQFANSVSLSSSNFNIQENNLLHSWSLVGGAGEGTSLPNNTEWFELEFDIIGSGNQNIIMSGLPLSVELERFENGNLSTVPYFINNNGTLDPTLDETPVVLNIETEYSNNKAYTRVYVDNFYDMLGMQYSFNWDADALQFDTLIGNELFELTNPFTGVMSSNIYYENEADHVRVLWDDSSLNPQTLDQGSLLLELVFDIVGNGDTEVSMSDYPIIIEFTRKVEDNVHIVPYIINGTTTNFEGQFVFGKVFFDANENCIDDEETIGLKDWKVTLDGNKHAFTNSFGQYAFFVEGGVHTISVTPPADLWEICAFEYEVDLSNNNAELNIPAQAIVECPKMEVHIGAPLLRRCFSNFYYVDYCNLGSSTAENAYIEVLLDPYMTYESSSLPVTAQFGQLLRFDLGDVALGDCGSFKIMTNLNCDATTLGQTHCTEARIFPNVPCEAPPANWSGASLRVDGECLGDEVQFSIRNVGPGDMINPTTYVVIEDFVVIQTVTLNQLTSGKLKTIIVPSQGSTIRIEVLQVPNHPGNSEPNYTIEACGLNEEGMFSTGFVTQFSQDDGDLFVSIDCQENIGSFDPNDKQAFPKGYGDFNLIEENTDLEYLIRFQNTGTDTAFTVEIQDVLSEFLDENTIRLGAHSHPVRMELEGKKLSFHFENILLVDSTTNEAGSHGFVSFRINQQADNSIGTEIFNEAAIYFDFNEPVITNTTVHRIGEDFVEIDVATDDALAHTTALSIYPNPFKENTTFEIDDIHVQSVELRLFNNLGQLIRNEIHEGNRFQFDRKTLPQGIYFFELITNKKQTRTGRIIVK